MTNSPLDEDPYDVKSWEELGRWCIDNNKQDEFIKKINDFIYHSNLIEGIQLRNYIKKRKAEMRAEDMKNKSAVITAIQKDPSNPQTK